MRKYLDVVAALIQKNDQYLICQRHDNDAYGGLWEFPGGTVEEGESFKEAVVREIKEELGVDVEVIEEISKFEDSDETLTINITLFSCKIISGKIMSLECKSAKFFDKEKVGQLKLAPADRKIFNYLISS